MIITVVGGSASGKSEFAEEICQKLNKGKMLYIATMEPFGEDAKFRIKRHQQLRQGKGFCTWEKYRNLYEFNEDGYNTILLECMSTLLANEFFGGEDYYNNIVNAVEEISKRCETLVILTNNIFSDGIKYDEETENYIKAMGEINRYLGMKSTEFYEVVCGIGIRRK
ncbi:MAG: bifunctional adenosylcobinamide kinase/adenosylcobinamide-phosphate guanylyltransferase [Anaerotignaceae bacterium]